MKKLLFSIILVLSLALSPLSWAGTSDPVIEGKSATDIKVDGGIVNNTPIGSGTPQTGAFTTLSTTSDATIGSGGDPADAGAIRLKNADKIVWEASPAGADIEGIAVDANEIVQIGAAGASGVTITPAVTLNTGTSVTEFSTDGTLAGNSDDALPTEKAVNTFVNANTWMSNAYYPDYNEADQGATGSGKSAKAYIDTIVSDSATLVFRHNSGAATTTYTFSTSETIPSNINVIIEKGAILSIAAAQTLTINGSFDVGLYQVFGGDGSVAGLNETYLEWFGAVADGATDNYVAIAKAMSASTGPVYISKSLLGFAYETSLEIPRWTNLIGFHAINWSQADTVIASKLKWTGAANGTMLQSNGLGTNSGNIIEHITFNGNALADHAIDLTSLNEVKIRDNYFDGFTSDVLDLPVFSSFGIIERNRTLRLADGYGFFHGADRANGYIICNNIINMGKTSEAGEQSGSYGIKIYANGATIYGNSIEGTHTNQPTAGGRKGIIVIDGSDRVSIFGNRIELSWNTGQADCYGIDIQTSKDVQGLQHNEIFVQKDAVDLTDYHFLFSHANGGFSSVGSYITNPWAMDLFPRPDAPATRKNRIASSNGTADGTFGAKGQGLYFADGDPATGWKKFPLIIDIDNTDVSTSGVGVDTLQETGIYLGLLGINRGIRFSATGTVTNVNNGNKRVLISFYNATTVLPLANANEDWWVKGTIFNVAANSQRVEWTAGRGTSPATIYSGYETYAADTTATVLLQIKAECVDAADTITQTMWLVELF